LGNLSSKVTAEDIVAFLHGIRVEENVSIYGNPQGIRFSLGEDGF